MKAPRTIMLLAMLFASTYSFAAECGNSVTAEAATTLAANATLGEVTARFGIACAGDGPLSWYHSGNNKQIWFYWKRTTTPAASSTPVLMIAEVDASDPDQQKIIWPQALVGKDVASIMLGEFGPGK